MRNKLSRIFIYFFLSNLLFPGDELVAAQIHLNHLKTNEVLQILKVLEPYDDNMKILTKKDLEANAALGFSTPGLKLPHVVNTVSRIKYIHLATLIAYSHFGHT